MVAEVVPNCEVAFAEGATADARDYRVNFRKAEETLPGYAPRWTLREGIKQLHDAYRRADLTKEIFLGPRFYRLRTVRGLQERGLIDNDLRRVGKVTN